MTNGLIDCIDLCFTGSDGVSLVFTSLVSKIHLFLPGYRQNILIWGKPSMQQSISIASVLTSVC